MIFNVSSCGLSFGLAAFETSPTNVQVEGKNEALQKVPHLYPNARIHVGTQFTQLERKVK